MHRFFTLALTAGLLSIATGALAQTSVTPSLYDKAPWWMKEGVITQTGFVFTEIPANRAEFSATFLSVADTAEKAQAAAIEQTRALSQALGKYGPDKVRVTTSFSMRALYEQYKDKNGNRIENERGDKIRSYEVSLIIEIEVRDMTALERAYALVLAAAPTSTEEIDFSLQPDNATNTWLYSEAVKDARVRATQSAEAAGGKLGAIKLIDPTGRACQTDILARGAPETFDSTAGTEVVVSGIRRKVSNNGAISSEDVGSFPDKNAAESLQRIEGVSLETLEQKALNNPFVQSPPMKRLTAKSCVVYGLN